MTVAATQLPLIIESDDHYLEQHESVAWFGLLLGLDHYSFQGIAARYYEQLHKFNLEQQRERTKRRDQEPNPETQKQATLRLVHDRATMDERAPVLEPPAQPLPAEISVTPTSVEPGRVPVRLAGRQPKCFFAMFKAFIGVMVQHKPAEPETVWAELTNNPSYARACGFTLPMPDGKYKQSDIPSLRKIEQFDQIMTNTGIWDDTAVAQVARNLCDGKVMVESTLVHDTTHYPAYSNMKTVELPSSEENAEADAPEATKSLDEAEPEGQEKPEDVTSTKKKETKTKTPRKKKAKDKKKRKSHPKTTKPCRCENRAECSHAWVNADEGAGTVVKTGGKKSWAHKASTLGFPGQSVLISAVAMTDGATHDSRSVKPHLERLLVNHPELREKITRLLDDGAADDVGLKAQVKDEYGIELLTSQNPRGRRPIEDHLPRGIAQIRPTGTPVCRATYPFDFVGCRHAEERFIFRAPSDDQGTPVCQGCPQRPECYRGADGARQITLPFNRLPWINPEFPQLSIRYAKEMAKRTVIERLHKLMKYDYGDERLTKRGNKAFQARLSKTLLAMHIVLAQD